MATRADKERDETAPVARPTGRLARQAPAVGPVWTRQAAQKANRLTLEAILTAAIGLADAEGLEAVSVRRVAAELNARPMSLYSFFSRKDDLVELMVDQIIGEMLLDRVPDDWQEALRAIAWHTRTTGLRHPWFMAAVAQVPLIGPNALRHMEQSLAAIAGLGLDRDRARSLLLAIDFYTIGAGTIALAERQMRRRDRLTESQWRDSTNSYFERLAASEDLPHLAALVSPGPLRGADGDEAFTDGLNWLLAGFEATLHPGAGAEGEGH